MREGLEMRLEALSHNSKPILLDILCVQGVQDLATEVSLLQLMPVLAERFIAFFTVVLLLQQQLLKAIALFSRRSGIWIEQSSHQVRLEHQATFS